MLNLKEAERFKIRNRKEMGNHFSDNIKLPIKPFDSFISPILMYGSEIWGIDCNGKLDTDPEKLVQNKFLKWPLGVNKTMLAGPKQAGFQRE